MRRRFLAVGLDRLARHRRGQRKREHVREIDVRLLETDDQRVAVGRLQPRDRRLVIELAALLRLCRELIEPDDLAGEEKGIRRAVLWIVETAERVGVILRRELALLALERQIVSEGDALADAQGVGPA